MTVLWRGKEVHEDNEFFTDDNFHCLNYCDCFACRYNRNASKKAAEKFLRERLTEKELEKFLERKAFLENRHNIGEEGRNNSCNKTTTTGDN